MTRWCDRPSDELCPSKVTIRSPNESSLFKELKLASWVVGLCIPPLLTHSELLGVCWVQENPWQLAQVYRVISARLGIETERPRWYYIVLGSWVNHHCKLDGLAPYVLVASRQVFDPPAWCAMAMMTMCCGWGDPFLSVEALYRKHHQGGRKRGCWGLTFVESLSSCLAWALWRVDLYREHILEIFTYMPL